MTDTWERLITYQRRTLRTMDAHLIAESGHSLDDYDVLHQLRRAGEPLRIGELAERLLVAGSSCHRIVARLREQGLVSYEIGADDARTRHVGLTGSGRRLHRRLAAIHGRDISRLFTERLAPSDLDALGRVVDRLTVDDH